MAPKQGCPRGSGMAASTSCVPAGGEGGRAGRGLLTLPGSPSTLAWPQGCPLPLTPGDSPASDVMFKPWRARKAFSLVCATSLPPRTAFTPAVTPQACAPALGPALRRSWRHRRDKTDRGACPVELAFRVAGDPLVLVYWGAQNL